jgi:hypothetical protein
VNPERWLVVTVGLDSQNHRDLAAAELIALGGSSVVEQQGSITTYLPPPGDPSALLSAARERIAAAPPPAPTCGSAGSGRTTRTGRASGRTASARAR